MLFILSKLYATCVAGEYQDSSTGSEVSETARLPDDESDDGGPDGGDSGSARGDDDEVGRGTRAATRVQ